MKFSVNFDGLKVSDPLTMIEPHATYSVRFKGKLYSVAQKNCRIYSGFQLDEVQWQPVNSDTLAQPVYSAYLKSAVGFRWAWRRCDTNWVSLLD